MSAGTTLKTWRIVLKVFVALVALGFSFSAGTLYAFFFLQPGRSSDHEDVYKVLDVIDRAMEREWTPLQLKEELEAAVGKQLDDSYRADGWNFEVKTNPITGQGYLTVICYTVDDSGVVRSAWLQFTGIGFL